VKQIVHVLDKYAETGGVANYVIDCMDLLEKNGFENTVIYQEHDEHTRRIKDSRNKVFAPDFHAFQSALQKQNPDIVFLHTIYDPNFIFYSANNYFSVAYMHGFYPVCPGLAKYFRRTDVLCQQAFGWQCVVRIYLDRCASAKRPDSVARIMRRTREYQRAYSSVGKFLVANQYMKQLYVQNGFPESKIMILPPHFVYERPVDFLPKQAGQLLYVGRLEIEKGIPYLLRMLQKLPETFRLAVVGDGSMRTYYETMSAQMGIAQRVCFKGWLSTKALEDEYKTAAILIMPSLTESFGKVGIEAMYWGTPVVAFSVGGIPEWLQNGRTGYLIPPLDVDAMAECVKSLMADNSLRYEMGRNAIAYVNERFRAEDHARRLIDVFEE